MLSYQHQYHAGNFADVHKHLSLIACITYLQQKPKGFTVIDTHAGDGEYALHSTATEKTNEAKTGCLAAQQILQTAANTPALLEHYNQLVSNYAGNSHDNWQTYPGSPGIANDLARDDDAWVGFEQHPQAYSALKNLCKTRLNMSCHKRDAFEGLPALLPVSSGRALVIADPSYEVKQDYADIPNWLSAAHHKMPQMTIILWYPILPENRHQRMLSSLQQLDCKAYLVSEWHNTQSYQGMKGSGIFIMNPPWSIQQSFASTMDWLSQQHGFTDFNHTWDHKQS